MSAQVSDTTSSLLDAYPTAPAPSWVRLGQRAAECPFVNRADGRCASHLTMGQVNYAFDHCFDAYGACPVHAELSAEEAAAAVHLGDGRGRSEEISSDRGGERGDTQKGIIPAEINHAVVGAGRWRRLKSRIVELTVRRKPISKAA